jgi:hypothetical protein
MTAAPMHRLVQRAAHRSGWGRRPLTIRDDQLVRNPDGLRRLCAWLGIDSGGHAWEVAYRYLRWCKRNPQSRVDKR